MKELSGMSIRKDMKNEDIYKLPKMILEEILVINGELNKGYDLKELCLDLVSNSDYENAEMDLLI